MTQKSFKTKDRSLSVDSSLDPFGISNLIGQGRYQTLLIIFLCVFISPFMACNNVPQYLILLEPEHECNMQFVNTSYNNDINRNIPRVNAQANYEDIAHNPTSLLLRLKRECHIPNTNVSCPNGYKYKYDFIYPTIVSMNDWICDNDHLKYDAHSLYWLGSFCGVLVIGYISDKYVNI